jgi:ribosome biogenesis GTPase
MREVGMANTAAGLEKTFETILEYAKQCKFNDCTHTQEIGCAITTAVKIGELNKSSYQNYLNMEKEQAHFEATVAEKRKKGKDFGKMAKQFKKIKKNR